MHDVKRFFWDDPYLYKSCGDGMILLCVPEVEMLNVLKACHSSPVGQHHSGIRTSCLFVCLVEIVIFLFCFFIISFLFVC